MSGNYKTEIHNQIKEAVTHWIDELKEKEPALLLTKQWNVHYPKGFQSGNNLVAITTGSKKGKHLVGELNIFLPDSLELDLNSVELTLKNEPFQEQSKESIRQIPIPIDEPLDLLNDIIISINQFISQISIPNSPTIAPIQTQNQPHIATDPQINIQRETKAPVLFDNMDDIKRELLNSPDLPDWLRIIENTSIKNELVHKIAESYLHYQKQVNRKVEFSEFFNIFTEHLLKQNKLHHYCRYKAKPVELDANNFCTESYCSKKPYNQACPNTTLKFGEL